MKESVLLQKQLDEERAAHQAEKHELQKQVNELQEKCLALAGKPEAEAPEPGVSPEQRKALEARIEELEAELKAKAEAEEAAPA